MQLFDLKGKTAIITGASGGIGGRFAHVLSKAGARTILASRRIERLEKLSTKLRNSIAIKMDVSNKNSVENAFKQLENENIDICINCAGIMEKTEIFKDYNCHNFENTMHTNVIGSWYIVSARKALIFKIC